MPVFIYEVRSAHASTALRGELLADSPRHARDLLRAKSLTVLKLSEAKNASVDRSTPGPRSLKLHPSVTAQLLRELSTLIAVGTPLAEALDRAADNYRSRARVLVLALRDRVTAGESFAQTLRSFPSCFDGVCVSMAEVGEASGTLDHSLASYAAFSERWQKTRSRILNALLYPVIVVCMGIGVSVFLMTIVLPRLLEALVESGRTLPWPTLVVQTASRLLTDYWWAWCGAMIVGFFVLIAVRLNPTLKLRLDRAVLRVPIIGGLVLRQEIGRVAIVIAALLRSGVSFVEALAIARNVTHNLALSHALERCRVEVSEGTAIDRAFQSTGVFPSNVVHILALGQHAGRLAEVLERLAEDLDQSVSASLSRLLTMLEPIVVVLLAVFVGLIAFATLLPIIEAGDAL